VLFRSFCLEECETRGLPKSVGLSLFLVDTRAPGISKIPLNTRGEGAVKQFKVDFLNVRSPAEALIGKENEGALSLFVSFNIERVLFAAGVLAWIPTRVYGPNIWVGFVWMFQGGNAPGER
jgi:hypothetical protein